MARRMIWMAALAALSACDGEPEELDAAVVVDGGVEVDAFVETCERRSDCDDGRYCNGVESCEPGAADADARGCVPGEAPCLATQICDEDAEACETDCETAPDADGDGERAIACGGDDCDDSDDRRYPGATEVCDDEDHDEDCNVMVTHGARDVDGDLHPAICCNVGDDGTRYCSGTDCDDAVPSTNPAASDNTCDTIDNDCDSAVDEDAGAMVYYVDADGDGYGSEAAGSMLICGEPPPNYAPLPGDCRDDLPTVFPGAPQLCDGIENRCDGASPGEARAAEDMDGDGFAALDADCEGGDIPKTDCHDDVANAYPGADELCATDEIDENCDGLTFEGCPTGGLVLGEPIRGPSFGTVGVGSYCTYASDASCVGSRRPTPCPVDTLPIRIETGRDSLTSSFDAFQLTCDEPILEGTTPGSQIAFRSLTPFVSSWYVKPPMYEGTMSACPDGLLPAGVAVVPAPPELGAMGAILFVCDYVAVAGENHEAVLEMGGGRESPHPSATLLGCPVEHILVGLYGTAEDGAITEIGVTCATLELEYHPVPAP